MADDFADNRLLLLANEPDEVPVISALLQDAVLRAADLAWEPKARRLTLLVNRFRWEADATRVRAAFRVESVLRLQRRAWPADAMLDLLALTLDGDDLLLTFAGGAALRATVECVDLVLEDVSAPWPASRVPAHDA
ncbi:MAG: DUF2948 family protein [Sphingomonadaceae bacterium]|nr:DUF2948 family protein [Sphingomonadaceae bacterium]